MKFGCDIVIKDFMLSNGKCILRHHLKYKLTSNTKKISVSCLVGLRYNTFTKNIIVLKFEDIKVVLAFLLYFIMAINYNMTTQIKKKKR